jgi:hypothetical protein
MYGGFHLLHPSELIAPHSKYYIAWGLGSLGLRAIKGTNGGYVYPFTLDSEFFNDTMELDIILNIYGVNTKSTLHTFTFTLSNSDHIKSFEFPPFVYLEFIVGNNTEFVITKSIVKPIFTYTA